MRANVIMGSIAAVAAIVVACSSSSSSSTSQGFCCQVNGAAWDCPDEASLKNCTSLTKPDPSACASRSSLCNGSASSSSGSSGSSGSSSGSSGSSSGSSGQTSSCSLFTCNDTAGCGGVAPCMSTSTGKNYCYEQEGNAADCSSGTVPTTKMVAGSSRTLCVPPGCPDPDTYVP